MAQRVSVGPVVMHLGGVRFSRSGPIRHNDRPRRGARLPTRPAAHGRARGLRGVGTLPAGPTGDRGGVGSGARGGPQRRLGSDRHADRTHHLSALRPSTSGHDERPALVGFADTLGVELDLPSIVVAAASTDRQVDGELAVGHRPDVEGGVVAVRVDEPGRWMFWQVFCCKVGGPS